jgi:hypothetical protein
MSDFTNGIQADYWSVDDAPERLAHESICAAVADYLEESAGAAGVQAAIAGMAPITVHAWKRQSVTSELANSIAIDLAERVIDDLEEYVDPDGENASDEALEMRLIGAFSKILKKELMGGEWRPWACERAGTVTLTTEQVETMMRGLNPHWFEAAPKP